MQSKVKSGQCYRCKHIALLYVVFSKVLEKEVYVCYECREIIKNAVRLKQ